MNPLENISIGQIVAEDYRAAEIFNRYNLDFCRDGSKTIIEACEQPEQDANAVLKELVALGETDMRVDKYNRWPLDLLTDYIIDNHHEYTKRKVREIQTHAHKAVRVHGKTHPELDKIENAFVLLSIQLTNHMNKEERSLFPYIKKLAAGDLEAARAFRKESEFDPVKMLEHDHDEVGTKLAEIRELSDNYTPPKDACTTCRILFKNLEAFEHDMRKHIHLENNILFPKTVELEQRLN